MRKCLLSLALAAALAGIAPQLSSAMPALSGGALRLPAEATSRVETVQYYYAPYGYYRPYYGYARPYAYYGYSPGYSYYSYAPVSGCYAAGYCGYYNW
jgi:hypothetical protein